MSVSVPIFLETTIQIDKIIGLQEVRETIRHNLRGNTACTSGHVFAEFKKTLVKDATLFRNILLTSPDVKEAVLRFTKSYSRGRKYPRTISLLAILGLDNDRQNTLSRLEYFIECQAEDVFWESIDQPLSTDKIKCIYQAWSPEKDRDGSYGTKSLTCVKNRKPECLVFSFIKDNRTLIQHFITRADKAERASNKKAADVFQSIISGQDVPYGQENCYCLSDVLIVIEANPEYEVYSHDGDVTEICGIFGRSVFAERALPSKPT